jgi:hypothetical protein
MMVVKGWLAYSFLAEGVIECLKPIFEIVHRRFQETDMSESLSETEIVGNRGTVRGSETNSILHYSAYK